MAVHPLNLAVRFLLEIAALVAIGYWGFREHTGILQFLLGIGLPLLAAASWGIFAVPGDRSRSGDAPVPVPGVVRLILELALFGLAAWALYDAGNPVLAFVLAGVTLVHYALSYDRVAWLLGQNERYLT
jgi:drug/metabolite transporter (DMT)-like permease